VAGFRSVTSTAVAADAAMLATTTAAASARHNRQHRPIRKVVAIVNSEKIDMNILNLRANLDSQGCRAALKLYHMEKYLRWES
jgi:glycyl-tRNA synthetase beta subunit